MLFARNPSLLCRDESVLLVVDMQEPSLNSIHDREGLQRAVRVLIAGSGILGVPVIATLQNQARMGGVVEEIAAVLPDGTSPMDKMRFSCAGEPAVQDVLERSGRRQVLICGVETHICVLQTALDLTEQGFQVHVAADAVSSRSQVSKYSALDRMENSGVILTTVESALYEMLQQAGTPEFKQILQLVR